MRWIIKPAFAGLIFILSWAITVGHSQTLDCSDIINQVLTLTGQKCAQISRDQACYGNVLIEAQPQPQVTNFQFTTPGDLADVADLQSLRLSELNQQTNRWGVAYLHIQANLPDTAAGQYVTMLVFGNTELSNASKTVSTAQIPYKPMQAVYFRSGLGAPMCKQAPTNGMIVQNASGNPTATLTIDGVELTIASTVFIEAPVTLQSPGTTPVAIPTNTPRVTNKRVTHVLFISTIEGNVTVTAKGQTQIATTEHQVSVPLDDQMQPAGPPTSPGRINTAPLHTLEVQLGVNHQLLIPTATLPATPTRTPRSPGGFVQPFYPTRTATFTPTSNPPPNNPPPNNPVAPTNSPAPPTNTPTATATPICPLIVQNLNDSGYASLRYIISCAPPNSTIAFQTGLVGTLTVLSPLVITTNLTINGLGTASTIISGGGTIQVFQFSGAGGTLNQMTITQGKSATNGGGILNSGPLVLNSVAITNNSATVNGGGLFSSSGTVSLSNTTFTGNSAVAGGGLDVAGGTLNVSASNFNGNSATGTANTDGGGAVNIDGPGVMVTLQGDTFTSNTANTGGGVYAQNGTTIINNSTFSSNTATGAIPNGGGGLKVFSTTANVTVTGSTFKNNMAPAGYGGGVYGLAGTLNMTNDTIGGNSAAHGGGLYNYGVAVTSLNFLTIANNTSTVSASGGIYDDTTYSTSAILTFGNTLLASNTPNDCGSSTGVGLVSNNYNLIQVASANCVPPILLGTTTNNFSAIPLLNVFGNNGGSTETYSLQAGSPAIDKIPAPCLPSMDQRGVARPNGASCDIGAYEH